MKSELINDYLQLNTSVRDISMTQKYEHRIKSYCLKLLEEYNKEPIIKAQK